MKTHMIVISILLALGCQQCTANVAAQVDPLGLYMPREVELSSVYLPNPEISAFAAIKPSYPIDQQAIIPNVPQRSSFNYILRRIVDRIRTTLRSIFYVLRRILSVPVGILKLILWPVTLMFDIAKFFLKLFFLPVVIAWKLFKVALYPVKFILNAILAPSPTVPYVIGMPSNQLIPNNQLTTNNQFSSYDSNNQFSYDSNMYNQ